MAGDLDGSAAWAGALWAGALRNTAQLREQRKREADARAFRHERCPARGARPGESCRTHAGAGEPTGVHAARRRLAIYKPLPPDG